MLPKLRSILKIKSIVLTAAASCFINLALATGLAHSQGLEKRITIDVQNKPLKQTLDQIAASAQMVIIYSNTKGIIEKPVTIHEKDQPVSRILNELLLPLSLTYEVIDDRIVIKFDNASSRPPSREKPPFPVKGKVTDANGLPLPGATVKIKNGPAVATTNSNGDFQITNVADSTILQVSFVGYVTKEIVVRKAEFLTIVLEIGSAQLNEVVVSTGYQTLPKERATGSFVQINNELLNRRVGTDIISRLEGVVPGLLFNRNTINGTAGAVDISIRGTNTLYANAQPLIVIDGFPYDGDFNNINPNDVESVTVLKDAAAASIWGVRSGNGVIVITTKKGKRNEKLNVEMNANVTIGNKPNLYYSPNFLPANDVINLEQTLFNKGYFDSNLSSGYSPVSPVVQILANQRAGTISAADATSQINALRNTDVRDQLNQYFYQKTINQQYALNLRGGNSNSDYVFSLGDDQDRSYFKGNQNGRITLNSLYNFYPLKDLQISAGFNYTQVAATTNNPIYNNGGRLTFNNDNIYPYAKLVDVSGNALAIPKDYSLSFTSNADGKLLDWAYRPLDELNNEDNTSKMVDNRISLGMQYGFLKDFRINLKYQYEHAVTNQLRNFSSDTYYARNLINQYTQIGSGGSLTYPIPVGGILQQTNAYLTSQRGRAQLYYNHSWNQKHELSAIAGAEISEAINESNSNTSYGYDKNTGTSYGTIDYSDSFNITPYGYGQRIPNSLGFGKTTDHYISYFSNASYTYNNRYILSLSGRIDKSNLFGVNTNQKSVPLYSSGLAWDLSKEDFYHLSWLPYAKLRATYGYTGNINKSATAVTTIRQFSNSYYSGNPYAIVINPGNPELRWEKTRMINFGLDYAFKNSIIAGSVEYYIKKGTDIFGDSPLAPSTGLTTFFGNTADIKGNGVDIVINTKNINGTNFRWTTNFLLSHVVDIVTKYDVTLASSSYIQLSNASSVYPLTGKSLYGLYSYKWAGLTHNTGDPQGYVNGQVSTDYAKILSGTSIDDMVYNGSSRPTTFGSFRNTFSYKDISLSFNIIYKLNYFFRRSSYTSSALPYNGNTDFYKRWQNPGDESSTNVPALMYPPYNTNRDQFYQNSSVLIDKGDHIRLQDITLSYDLTKQQWKKSPFTKFQLYTYLNNVGILWRANHDHLDPDLSTNSTFGSYPLPRMLSFGIKANF
ncbi:SusC/RagA family TonB-linked outer membrane protein [Mucilaginibacter gracilis]|nr:SusC/RagA family TonB-linked outer membrane protein [Mucilaginibacter gracilis]